MLRKLIKQSLIILVMATIIALLFLQTSLKKQQPPSPMLGKPVPVFSLPMLDDPQKNVTEKTLQGQYYLVNIFGTWCSICHIEHPFLNRIAEDYTIPILGINWNDYPEDTLSWLAQQGNPYAAVAMDVDGSTVVNFGVRGAPETFLIGPDQTIVEHYRGLVNMAVFKKRFLPHIKRETP